MRSRSQTDILAELAQLAQSRVDLGELDEIEERALDIIVHQGYEFPAHVLSYARGVLRMAAEIRQRRALDAAPEVST